MKIGLITYHSAYNFGSALQAYATLKKIEEICHGISDDIKVEIIDLRLEAQDNYYKPLYRKTYGMKEYIQDLMMKPLEKGRRKRNIRYEQFFEKYYSLSKYYSSVDEVVSEWEEYDLIVSGSDQIWNKYSNELRYGNAEDMRVYLLDGYYGKKISYASSIGIMSEKEVREILPAIKAFDFLSLRETNATTLVSSLLGKSVTNVCDPTMLLTTEEWRKSLNLTNISKEDYERSGKKYILYYGLVRAKKLRKNLRSLRTLADAYDLDVLIITPFSYYPIFDKRFHYCPSLGPVEFLEAINRAQLVITNSYHGTLFSIYMEKEFFVYDESRGKDTRCQEILEKLGLEKRIIFDIGDVVRKTEDMINYSIVNKKKNEYRLESISYLESSINFCMKEMSCKIE